jgi:hypothetical protein
VGQSDEFQSGREAENPYRVMGDIVKPWLRNTYGAFRRPDCLVWRSLIAETGQLAFQNTASL